MRIVYCIPGLHNRSGMEHVLTLKANYLTAQGYDIHIILTDGAGKASAFPLNSQIQVHQLDIDFEEPYYSENMALSAENEEIGTKTERMSLSNTARHHRLAASTRHQRAESNERRKRQNR